MSTFWNQPITALAKKSKSLEKLNAVGINSISDLLNIIPLTIYSIPSIKPFSHIRERDFFYGHGTILAVQSRPNFWAKGKGKVLLHNIVASVRDNLSESILQIKWYNCYPTVVKKITKESEIFFIGQPEFKGQIITFNNPEFKINEPFFNTNEETQLKINYPTINSVPGKFILSLIEKIPKIAWNELQEILPTEVTKGNKYPTRSECYKILHGQILDTNFSKEVIREKLALEELLIEQLKIQLRKSLRESSTITSKLISSGFQIASLYNLLDFELTNDQKKSLEEIVSDLKKEHQMFRLIQGDVGCGKTAIALLAAVAAIRHNGQVALMCPTEALAMQHFQEVSYLSKKENFTAELLTGSTTQKNKSSIYQKLESGEIQLIVGTHSLFQESVKFKSLKLVIIDEQHKFGVEQRQQLINKGISVHCLLMSATPIPRSLSMTLFGDMDLSIIKELPAIRKGHKTRIVNKENFDKYLSFFKTRIEMGEQAYIVAPAIDENSETDIINIEQAHQIYKKYFPQFSFGVLHGRLNSEEKKVIIDKFSSNKIQILISTTVIEVGINIHNATIMAILGPDRFGLSTLHQLRGRIGRGAKPGFCFLITDENTSKTSFDRLRIIEQTNDGFIISEEDLKIRGEGDLFGVAQAGAHSHKFADLSTDYKLIQFAQEIIFKYHEDLQHIISEIKNNDSIKYTH